MASAQVDGGKVSSVLLTGREHEHDDLVLRMREARDGRGGLLIVSGESGAGKTSFVESCLQRPPEGSRILWGACDPLSTPRPLGPFHDLADQWQPTTTALLRDGDQPHAIFGAVFDDLQATPSVLVVDDLHWADQATVDLLRFVLRRIRRTSSLVVGIVRDDEIGTRHPMRSLLGDVARSAHASSLALRPLGLDAVAELAKDRPVDPDQLRRITGGNAFFVVEMLDHPGDELPTSVRDAILARTVNLGSAEWDLLHLLACAPEAIPDHLLAHLGVTLPALRAVDQCKLIRRGPRGVAFRHDLCRLALASVIPPGAEAALHGRMIEALEAAAPADPAVLTHHALGAGDRDRIRRAATDAGLAAVRSGAHTQATEFFETALDRGGPRTPQDEAGLLEMLAQEYYLTDRLDDAIAACRRAMHLREQAGQKAAVSADHHSLSVYEYYNANRSTAEHHVAQAVAVLDGRLEPDGPAELAMLGHAFAMQAFLAVQATDLGRASTLVAKAREIADRANDPTLVVRVGLIEGYCGVLASDGVGRDAILSIIEAAPEHFDEIYSSGYSNLSYLDIEQRRLGAAAELLDVSLSLTIERDLPICHAWQLGSRGRLELLTGDWDRAVADAETVLRSPSAPLARTWPLLVRALVALRRDGSDARDVDDAWRLACRYGESIRLLPAAAAIAERAWLSGQKDDRLADCRALLERAPREGLEWARGELAVWLRRLDPTVDFVGLGSVAEPYRLLLHGEYDSAATEFERLATPYEAALALVDSGEPESVRRAVDCLDRLGACAVAAKVRRDLRSSGATPVPARRRGSTLMNPAGLTARQVEVLRLMDHGLTNAELAARLYLSAKTVDHHVSAILAKLQVGNRRDAVRRAREFGIVGGS